MQIKNDLCVEHGKNNRLIDYPMKEKLLKRKETTKCISRYKRQQKLTDD